MNYLTQKQIGKKRHDLFVKKVQYQTQLMTLKEKGRRLLIADKVDHEQMKIMNYIVEHDQHQHVKSDGIKERLLAIVNYTNEFEEKALKHSEKCSAKQRTDLAGQLGTLKNFNNKTKYIDQKIEYD